MEPIAVAVVSALCSIAVALAGAWVAKRKGLPAINAEIEQRNGELIDLLKDQIDALERKLASVQRETVELRDKLKRQIEVNDDLRRRVTLAEGDLVALQRETGRRPSPRRGT